MRNRSKYTYQYGVTYYSTGSFFLSLVNRVRDRIVATRWARFYVLSREIGQRRAFIARLRGYIERFEDVTDELEAIQWVLREERLELVQLIAEREALTR